MPNWFRLSNLPFARISATGEQHAILRVEQDLSQESALCDLLRSLEQLGFRLAGIVQRGEFDYSVVVTV